MVNLKFENVLVNSFNRGIVSKNNMFVLETTPRSKVLMIDVIDASHYKILLPASSPPFIVRLSSMDDNVVVQQWRTGVLALGRPGPPRFVHPRKPFRPSSWPTIIKKKAPRRAVRDE